MLSKVRDDTIYTLNTTLALARDEISFPSMFLILPKRGKKSKWLFHELLKKPDKWLNKKLMVVFICAKTMRAATYNGKPGLSFKVPKASFKKAIDFWATFGPVSSK